MASSRQTRQPFGQGPLAERSTSVFIKCPYDEEFRALFDAIVFATICCGFTPRSALETGTVAEPRIARILRAMMGSKYSIHDLSRCKGEGEANLARFNMPLELGMAMARRYLSRRLADKHDWLVLVPSGHRYQAFVSDIAGFDPAEYDGSVPGIVTAVMAWLARRLDATRTPNPQQVLALLPDFNREIQTLRDIWERSLPWVDILSAGLLVARKLDAET